MMPTRLSIAAYGIDLQDTARQHGDGRASVETKALPAYGMTEAVQSSIIAELLEEPNLNIRNGACRLPPRGAGSWARWRINADQQDDSRRALKSATLGMSLNDFILDIRSWEPEIVRVVGKARAALVGQGLADSPSLPDGPRTFRGSACHTQRPVIFERRYGRGRRASGRFMQLPVWRMRAMEPSC